MDDRKGEAEEMYGLEGANNGDTIGDCGVEADVNAGLACIEGGSLGFNTGVVGFERLEVCTGEVVAEEGEEEASTGWGKKEE